MYLSKLSVRLLHQCNITELHCDKIVLKRDIHSKIFVVVSIHIAIRTSKHLNKEAKDYKRLLFVY